MALRAQISLMFRDKDLYENFIVPSKAEKVLNDIIIKCLSAYYYDEEVRNKVEGISMADVIADSSAITDSQQICNNIREALAMQSFMASELENTINDGVDDIGDIMNKVDDLSTGFVKHTQTEYGEGIPQLSLQKSTSPNTESSVQQTANTAHSDANAGYNSFVIEYLMRAVLGTEGIARMNAEYDAMVSGQPQETQETPSESVTEQVVITENKETVISEEVAEPAQPEVTESVEVVPEVSEPEVPEPVEEVEEEFVEEVANEVAEDATDALLSLFQSL